MAVIETLPGVLDSEARQLSARQLLKFGQAVIWTQENQRVGETRYHDFLHLYVGDPRKNEAPPEVVRDTEEFGEVSFDTLQHLWFTDSGKLVVIRGASEIMPPIYQESHQGKLPAEHWFAAIADLEANTTHEWASLDYGKNDDGVIMTLPLPEIAAVPVLTNIGTRDALNQKRAEIRHTTSMLIVMSKQHGVYFRNPDGAREPLNDDFVGLMRDAEVCERYRRAFGTILADTMSE